MKLIQIQKPNDPSIWFQIYDDSTVLGFTGDEIDLPEGVIYLGEIHFDSLPPRSINDDRNALLDHIASFRVRKP